MIRSRRTVIRFGSVRRGFTLVELMISIAIVLILIIGVNKVFQVTSNTIGTGNAFNEVTRTDRMANRVFFNDLHNAVTGTDLPFFIIHSERRAAFRDAADEQSAREYAKLPGGAIGDTVDDAMLKVDYNSDNVEGTGPGETMRRTLPTFRNHRTDQFSIFVRNIYKRQTGDGAAFSSDIASSEAWISYGHVLLPNYESPTPRYQPPGGATVTPTRLKAGSSNPPNASDNPNNYYARQWILGRTVMLLRRPTGTGGGPFEIRDGGNNVVTYIGRLNDIPTSLEPLAGGSHSTVNGTGPNGKLIEESRFDLAGTTVDVFRGILNAYVNAAGPPPEWSTQFLYRFQADPKPARPLDSTSAAQAVPCFLPACTQFVVEFAGDYMKQQDDPASLQYGEVTAVAPDGKIDYFVDKRILASPVRKIRWYGFPRDVDGDGVIRGSPAIGAPNNNLLLDVVPVRDVARTLVAGAGPLGFERDVATLNPTSGYYADPANAGAEIASNAVYTCGWGPGTGTGTGAAPKMIRIVLALDDAGGKLADAQTYEYVIEIP